MCFGSASPYWEPEGKKWELAVAQRQNAHVGARAVPCGSKGVPRGYRLRMKPRCVYLQRLWLPRGAHIERLAPAPTQRIKILVGGGHFLWLPLKAYRRPSTTAGTRSIFFFFFVPPPLLSRPAGDYGRRLTNAIRPPRSCGSSRGPRKCCSFLLYSMLCGNRERHLFPFMM